MPLASNPEIQKEVMKKLKLDGRSAEERLMEELKLERENEETKQIVLTLQEDGAGGIASRP